MTTKLHRVDSHRVDFLVTGASGFTGSFVTDLLLSKGRSVRALVRDKNKAEELRQRGVEVVVGDLNDDAAITSAVQNVGCIFHIAALFRQAGLPPSEFHRVNVEGTRLLIEKAAAAGVGKMVHCSTVGVLGHIDNPPADEMTPYNPGDPYQQSKMEGEKLFLDAVKSGKIRGVVIRPAMIYGPGDSRTLKIFKPIAKRRFFYVGRGEALVHFIDVRDLAESFLLAAENDQSNGEVFIIAGESSLPLRELASTIAGLMGVSKPWLQLPVRPMQMLGTLCEAICTPLNINPPIFRRRVDFFTKDRCFDTTKAQRVLGFKPKRHLEQELVEIIESYVQSGDIPGHLIKQPSVMLRGICGEIRMWNEPGRSIYGWGPDQAVGSVSHELLATKFPIELEEINKRVAEKGEWSGTLLHRDSKGVLVKVKSTWKLLRKTTTRDPLILEINEPEDLKQGLGSFAAFTCSSIGALC